MAQKLLTFSMKIYQQSKAKTNKLIKSNKIINEDLISQTSRKIILDPIPKKHRRSIDMKKCTTPKSGFGPQVLFNLNSNEENRYEDSNINNNTTID